MFVRFYVRNLSFKLLFVRPVGNNFNLYIITDFFLNIKVFFSLKTKKEENLGKVPGTLAQVLEKSRGQDTGNSPTRTLCIYVL